MLLNQQIAELLAREGRTNDISRSTDAATSGSPGIYLGTRSDLLDSGKALADRAARAREQTHYSVETATRRSGETI